MISSTHFASLLLCLGVIALTFDDGPGPDMLNLATFFVTGTLYGCIYDRASFHTWSHQNLANLEVTKLEGALANIVGKKPTYMQPPYLATSSNMQSVLGNLGYRIINCDIDSKDWNGLLAQASFQRIASTGASGNGHIPLMHEAVASTPSQPAPMVINWAKQNNLRMVTVADYLGDTQLCVSGTGTPNRNC
ncbi:hypothetical protein BDZ91DRAFT_773538 [Kalaharituber pfeilii]|nr:hypothetical protein BDZ91DRAFT_773538 [Kalaharituber pfeilii]